MGGLSDSTILVMIEPTGWRAETDEPDEAIHLARELLERARAAGNRTPYASFYVDGKLERGRVTRTDLATRLGRCWCGRGSLYGYPRPGEAFCCAAHERLWAKMTKLQRTRVIVARFIAIYGGGSMGWTTGPGKTKGPRRIERELPDRVLLDEIEEARGNSERREWLRKLQAEKRRRKL